MSVNTTLNTLSVDLSRELSLDETVEFNDSSEFFQVDGGRIVWNGNTRFDVDGEDTLKDEVEKAHRVLDGFGIQSFWEVDFENDWDESGGFEYDDYGVVNEY